MQEEQLRGIPDIEMLAKKFQKKKANLQTVISLYQAVSRLPAIQSLFSLEGIGGDDFKDAQENQVNEEKGEEDISRRQARRVQELLIEPLGSIVTDFTQFETMVEATV